MAEGAVARVRAARAVAAVVDGGRSLDQVLADWPSSFGGPDRALATMLAYGTLRHYRRLGALVAPRLRKKPQPLLDALLRVGLYQLEYTRVPPHAAVHATVAAAGQMKFGRARGLINALLRQHQRDPLSLAAATNAVTYSYPDWLADQMAADWPERFAQVLASGNERAPMHVRVNRRRAMRDDLRRRWADADLATTPIEYCDDGLTLDYPVSVDDLPGFAEGEVSVQDGAAQLAAGLLAVRDGDRVLDACAAPGNKTAQLLERADIDLVALDVDEQRMAVLENGLNRLGLSARTQVGDAGRVTKWWDGRRFDRILLDAPCSGTGVIRRHPDIKWLRRPGDVDAASRRQRELVRALWPLLVPGGRMVYATCSILRAEGTNVIEDFLAKTPDAVHVPIEADWGCRESCGRRLAPGQHGFDGFYYAVLERSTG